jgi:hypothetical protein
LACCKATVLIFNYPRKGNPRKGNPRKGNPRETRIKRR